MQKQLFSKDSAAICSLDKMMTEKNLNINERNYPKLIFHLFILEADAQDTSRISTRIESQNYPFSKIFQSRLSGFLRSEFWKKFDGIVSKCLEQTKLTLKCFLKDSSSLKEWDFHFQRIEILKQEGFS